MSATKRNREDEHLSTLVAAAKFRALRRVWDARGPVTAGIAFSYVMSRRDHAAEEQSDE